MEENFLNTDKTQTATGILEKRLKDIETEKEKFIKQTVEVEGLLDSLKLVCSHPRHSSLIPVSNLVYANANLVTTEFLVKHGDYKTLSSLEQTHNYLKGIIESLKEKEEACVKEIQQLEERILYITNFNQADVQKTDKGFILNRDGFMEIIEVEDTPYKKERIPKFKTNAERDEYLKKHCSKVKNV